jgi:hypothetical protein
MSDPHGDGQKDRARDRKLTSDQKVAKHIFVRQKYSDSKKKRQFEAGRRNADRNPSK